MKLSKMNWQKKGAGGGGGGGMDPMQMISILLMIITLVMSQCKEEEKKEQKDINSGDTNLPSPTTVTKSCSDLSGFKCNSAKENCKGNTLPANDNTNDGLCYSEKSVPLEGNNNTILSTTSESCAAQKGFDCRLERYCPNNQWISAKDTQTCCKIECISRIQTTVNYPNLGEVVIEKMDTSFGVWYGQDPQTKSFDINIGFKAIGHPNFARARSLGTNNYEFTIDEKSYKFVLTKNEASEITVMIG